ncbi:28S ribosomal mitochondrial [Brachionus plicatilis]|uniref:28S ribosomal mitochondrial n=1 Tax=Brachionus plicatilis TaxID=10195 RepID=A0A3M7QV35_BRAPC|nr:28S ribosomal mitochondrial [Brachionus plicatilis]
MNRFGVKIAPNVRSVLAAAYSTRSKNILRQRYQHRNKDGTFKEFNESITVVPKEFEQQDEYKNEKRVGQIYQDRYKKQQQAKQYLFTLKLSKEEIAESVEQKDVCEHRTQEDGTIQLEKSPYRKKQHQCIFCKYNVPLDYKNVQLLSQFVSPHTGLLYGQEVTGLCYFKYKELENTLFKARKLGLMPFFYKETVFVNDPNLFDPFKNNLKQIPDDYDKRKLNADPKINE